MGCGQSSTKKDSNENLNHPNLVQVSSPTRQLVENTDSAPKSLNGVDTSDNTCQEKSSHGLKTSEIVVDNTIVASSNGSVVKANNKTKSSCKNSDEQRGSGNDNTNSNTNLNISDNHYSSIQQAKKEEREICHNDTTQLHKTNNTSLANKETAKLGTRKSSHASYVGSNDSTTNARTKEGVKISANYVGSDKSQINDKALSKMIVDNEETGEKAPVSASYVGSDKKTVALTHDSCSEKHADFIGSDKLGTMSETKYSAVSSALMSSQELPVFSEYELGSTDNMTTTDRDDVKTKTDTTSAKSTELAVDLEYPDDDMSGPAPTQVKYEDIMPNADILKVLAEHVRQNPIALKPTLGPLVKRLIKPAKTDIEKVWTFYRWIVINIKYDVEGFFGDAPAKPTDPVSVLKSGITVCEGYTNLFQAFCEKVNIEAKTISGYAKSCSYTIGEDVRENEKNHHAWNSVLINGNWFLLDCTWGAGFVKRKDKTFVRWPNDFYFCTAPEMFASDHFPMMDDDYSVSCKWQLLENPLTVETFTKRVNMNQPGKEWGILTHHHPYAVIECQNETDIMIEESHTPMHDYLVHMRNEDYQLMDHYTFAYKFSKTFKVHIRPPAIGEYMCQIYGRRTIDGPDANLQPLVLYKLHCIEVFDRPREFPTQNVVYGPVRDIQTFGFSHTGNVLYKAEFGEVTILLNPLKEVSFVPKLFIGDTEFDYLLDHCFVQYSEDFRHVTVSLRLPFDGFFRLTLFGKQSHEDDTGSDDGTPKTPATPIYNVRFRKPSASSIRQNENNELKPFVSYLIDNRQPSDKEPFPKACTAALKYKCCLLQPCDKEVKARQEIKVCVRSLFLERVKAGEDIISKVDESTFAGVTVTSKADSKLVIYGSESTNGNDFVELYECIVTDK